MQVSLESFRENMLKLKGSAIVTLDTETKPEMPKRGNPYASAVKCSKVNGIINWIYTLAVNRQRVREELVPDFKAFPRVWGQRIRGTPLVEHNGKYYLEMKVQGATCHYRIGNVEVSHADIAPWLRPYQPTRQGVSKEVILRDYALENIRAITCDSQTYEIS